jgi:hypothetical protein
MSDTESFVDKVVSVIPSVAVPEILKRKRKPRAKLTLAAQKKQLATLQRALGRLVRDVDRLVKSIAAQEKKAKPAVERVAKRAAKRPVRRAAAKRK